MRAIDTPLGHFAIDCNLTALEANRALFGEDGIGLPDPTAMAVALDPSIAIRTSRHAVDVECEGTLTRGMTVKTGAFVAEGRVVHRGSRIMTAEGKLLDGEGKLLAHGTTTCMLLER